VVDAKLRSQVAGPVNVPVAESKMTPGGTEPLVIAYEYGPVPPVTLGANTCEVWVVSNSVEA